MADETSKVSGSLLATMVHDLRNPLSALAGNLALLNEELIGVDLSGVGRRCLDDSLALCTRALLMVQSIADVDALEQGTISVRPRITRLLPECIAAVAHASVDTEARELTVKIECSDTVSAVVDGRLLARVIQNLVDNAVRYAPRNGRVVIQAANIGTGADKKLMLSVGNSGPALTRAERSAVFDRDYRSVERQAGARLGRDFGLYFCRLVIEAHRGTIVVEEREDLPAVFLVAIPQ